MAAKIKIDRIERDGKKLHIYFDDGTSREYESRKQAKQEVRAALSDEEAVELLKTIAVARALKTSKNDDDADELDLLAGKTVRLDLSVANIVRIG